MSNFLEDFQHLRSYVIINEEDIYGVRINLGELVGSTEKIESQDRGQSKKRGVLRYGPDQEIKFYEYSITPAGLEWREI